MIKQVKSVLGNLAFVICIWGFLNPTGWGQFSEFEDIEFTDIAGDPREELIELAGQWGVVSGYPDGSFKPNQLVSREQMVAMMVASIERFLSPGFLVEPALEDDPFIDVDKARWSARAIAIAKELKLVSGYKDGTFKPQNILTRAEAVSMNFGLFTYLRKNAELADSFPSYSNEAVYQDISQHWARSKIQTLHRYCYADTGLVASTNKFFPNSTATRATAVSIIVRGYQCLDAEVKDEMPDLPEPADDILEDSLNFCSLQRNNSSRQNYMDSFLSFELGERKFSWNELASSKTKCVEYMLPIALHMNAISGVPASTIISQAIQETGWCKSALSKKSLNYHGQKAKFSSNLFRYWSGGFVWHSSSESTGGSGNNRTSKFMKFDHFDNGFFSMVERLFLNGLPYRNCMDKRSNTSSFMRCIGKSWAVHSTYAEAVLGHRRNFRHLTKSSFRLRQCDIEPKYWQLDSKFNPS